MDAAQAHENFEYLHAHVQAVDAGLQALLDLLGGMPDGQLVQAVSMRTLLGPLAEEARQAAPLALMMAAAEAGVLQ